MRIQFNHHLLLDERGEFLCVVKGLDQTISFHVNPCRKDLYFEQAEAHLIVRKLRALFMQRHVMYCIMGYEQHEKMEILTQLQADLNATSIVPVQRLYDYILMNKQQLLAICPRRRNSFSVFIESLILYAIKKA